MTQHVAALYAELRFSADNSSGLRQSDVRITSSHCSVYNYVIYLTETYGIATMQPACIFAMFT